MCGPARTCLRLAAQRMGNLRLLKADVGRVLVVLLQRDVARIASSERGIELQRQPLPGGILLALLRCSRSRSRWRCRLRRRGRSCRFGRSRGEDRNVLVSGLLNADTVPERLLDPPAVDVEDEIVRVRRRLEFQVGRQTAVAVVPEYAAARVEDAAPVGDPGIL